MGLVTDLVNFNQFNLTTSRVTFKFLLESFVYTIWDGIYILKVEKYNIILRTSQNLSSRNSQPVVERLGDLG